MAAPFEEPLAELAAHLDRAEKAIEGLLPGEGPELLRVFEEARAALGVLFSFLEGPRIPAEGAPRIALGRAPKGVVLFVDSSLTGETGRLETEAFLLALRRRDEALLEAAELCGLWLGLCAEWAAAGFAPPVVISSLKRRGPRILELGGRLVE